MTTHPAPMARAGRREWAGFCVLMLPPLLVSTDVSVLCFAVPAISAQLRPSGTELLWIFDIHAFVLAGLLITMGSLGDRVGRRRLLLIGAVVFGTASLLAAGANSAETLIAGRALLGVGGAALLPSTMALTRTMFTDPGPRAMVIGIWSGVLTAGVALGPVLGGVLVEHFWWGSVFLVNLPATALLLLLGPSLLPESRDPAPGRFDLPSVPLSMAAVLPVFYGLKEIPSEGWNVRYVMAVNIGLLFAVLFVHRQRTTASPLVSPALFHARGFTPALALNVVAAFGMTGSMYFTTQYLQSVLGKSPLEAALWGLFPSVLVGVAVPVTTLLVRRGADRVHLVASGFATAASGYALSAAVGTGSLQLVLVGSGVLAAGLVAALAQLTALALDATPVERAGSASTLVGTGQAFGGALGVAALGSVGTALYHHRVTASAPTPARETLGGALAVAERLPGPAAESLRAAARAAHTTGMRGAMTAGTVVLLAAAVASLVALRGGRIRNGREPGSGHGDKDRDADGARDQVGEPVVISPSR
ncbi:MFS transporter [Streptomyces sp. DSM 3412]|uniref:MFS transporter n=1 Tax=Streptomyces gottesmaniae TaxID=3075518 RepID=A0ABU2YVR7_9ACTN|nr:MFS transporter [Streptomyces sp. DSM 3412]MDT0568418.1 MFS transporter [Streptomyces sp. DSM 3412]